MPKGGVGSLGTEGAERLGHAGPVDPEPSAEADAAAGAGPTADVAPVVVGSTGYVRVRSAVSAVVESVGALGVVLGMRRRASRKAAAVGGRSLGRGRRAAASSSSSAIGTSGRARRTGAGICESRARATARSSGPSNGTRPVRHSVRTIASE